jgi:thiol:disulfide interchange protein
MSTFKFQTGHWSDLLTKIKNTGSESIAAGKKNVFLYVCANWSMPCRKMETDTLSDQLVADFFNANFLNIRILMGIIPEADTRKKLNEALNVTVDTYPLCLFLDHQGKVLHQATGDLGPFDLINEAKTALSSKINNLLGVLK